MPIRLERALSPRGCQTAPVGFHCDGGGLYLQVTERKDGKGVNRSWVFRYRRAGKLRDMGLGPFPTVGLSDARERARQARLQLLDGVDPLQAKQEAKIATAVAAAKAKTFMEVAADYIEANKPGWKNAKHASQWESTLRTYVYPTIGSLPVAAVTDVHVMDILRPIWTSKTETASRVRGRIEKVLDRAKVLKLRTGENPARWVGHLDQLLPKKSQVAPVENHPAMAYAELPAFMERLRARNSISARALEFTIMTAARTNDTIGARWSEADMQEKTWTVPAGRLKGKRGARRRDHTVPLSDRALDILKEMRTGSTQASDFIFPGDNAGEGLSNMAMLELLRGMVGEGLTVHGLRSSFKDWCSEQTAYPNEMSEMALAHTVSDKVEAAYRRGDMRDRRRRMMEDWAQHCGRRPGPRDARNRP
jgi:integrase